MSTLLFVLTYVVVLSLIVLILNRFGFVSSYNAKVLLIGSVIGLAIGAYT